MTIPQGNDLSREQVADYLRAHPGFFDREPGLLAELDLPRMTGGAVSLAERQVRVLREQNEQGRRRLRELIDIARQNEELARRMHRLILTLLDADSPAAVFHALRERLRRDFRADKVALRLFAAAAADGVNPAAAGTGSGAASPPEFVGADSAGQALFRQALDGGMPVGGRPDKRQRAFLFGAGGEDIASAVLIPLGGDGWSGIMAIGSHERRRFQENMGVELLANMAEVLSLILKPWVAGR